MPHSPTHKSVKLAVFFDLPHKSSELFIGTLTDLVRQFVDDTLQQQGREFDRLLVGHEYTTPSYRR